MNHSVWQPVRSQFLLGIFFLVGCGGMEASVTGLITIDGKPAPEGLSVQFQPQVENASPSFGSTDSNGKYELYFSTQTKGVIAGKSKVTMSLPMEENDETGELSPPAAFKGIQIPMEYEDGSTEVDVTKGSNTINFDLAKN